MSESVLQTRWPRELIHHVFRYIHPGSVLKYSRLCRWMRICLSDPHFASLNLQCFDETSIDFDQLWLHWPPAYQEGYARKRQKHLQEEALRNMGCSFNFDVRWTVQTIDSVPIPPAIGFFEDLTHLTLENTFGFIGVIPDGVAALQSLRLLSITKMLDPQPFPIGICQLTNLTHLSLVHCSLMGTLPVEITKLTSLVSLNIGHNALYGTLPSDIGQLLRLHNLSLEDNQFSGPLPASLFDLAELEVLILDSNKFTGSLSPDIQKLSSLEFLFIRNNSFSGSFPREILNLTELREVCWCDSGLNAAIPVSEVNPRLAVILIDGQYNK